MFLSNSRNSSRKSTHLCDRDISPGRASRPPPTILASLAVWCTFRNGLSTTSGYALDNSPAIEYIFDTSMISSRDIGGSILANALASIVLPDPGGHWRRILCPPAAAIMRALLACS
jgi:hypothetical protein